MGGIEQPHESWSFLQEVDMSVFIQKLNDTLQRAEKVLKGLAAPDESEVEKMDEVIKQYRTGELDAEMFFRDEFDAKLNQEKLNKRNKVMAGRAIKLIKDNPKTSFFFAFGPLLFHCQTAIRPAKFRKNSRLSCSTKTAQKYLSLS